MNASVPPKLQVAVDLLSLDEALRLLAGVAPHVDVIEAGTPLIKQEGLRVVTAFKEHFPGKEIFADLKTMDAGELEARLAFEAGANLMTVLALAADETIAGAVAAAHRRGPGKRVVADLIGVRDRVGRVRELAALGVDLVELHSGLDEQAAHRTEPLDRLAGLVAALALPASVAGGVNEATAAQVRRAGAAVIVCGAAIYHAPDPAEAARRLRALVTGA